MLLFTLKFKVHFKVSFSLFPEQKIEKVSFKVNFKFNVKSNKRALDNKIIFQINLRTQKLVKFCGSCGSIKSIFQGILILCCKQTQNNNSQHNLKLDTPTFHLSPFVFGRIIYSAPFSCMNRQPIFVSGRNLGLLPSVHLNTP